MKQTRQKCLTQALSLTWLLAVVMQCGHNVKCVLMTVFCDCSGSSLELERQAKALQDKVDAAEKKKREIQRRLDRVKGNKKRAHSTSEKAMTPIKVQKRGR